MVLKTLSLCLSVYITLSLHEVTLNASHMHASFNIAKYEYIGHWWIVTYISQFNKLHSRRWREILNMLRWQSIINESRLKTVLWNFLNNIWYPGRLGKTLCVPVISTRAFSLSQRGVKWIYIALVRTIAGDYRIDGIHAVPPYLIKLTANLDISNKAGVFKLFIFDCNERSIEMVYLKIGQLFAMDNGSLLQEVKSSE